MEPGKQEQKTRLLGGTALEAESGEAAERVEQVGADTGRRLVHDDTRLAEDVNGHHGVGLHRQEETETLSWGQRVQALLQLRQPRRREVDVLE